MKEKYKLIIAILLALAIAGIVLVVNTTGGKKDVVVSEAVADIADSAVHSDSAYWRVLPAAEELEEVSNDNSLLGDSNNIDINNAGDGLTETEDARTIDQMDVWDLAAYLYGIDHLTTTRMLKLITIEDYPDDWMLDYYCACACVTRAIYPEDFGGGTIYDRFGGDDPWYSTLNWTEDEYGIADHAYGALRAALLDFHYIDQCNGMAIPWNYIYYSEIYGIYVWN